MAALELFNEEEIEAAESLVVLGRYQTKKETLNSKFRFFRWGSKRRRSVPKDSKIDEDEEGEMKKRLSPSTPLSFSSSRGDPFPPPPPPPPPPIMMKVFKKMEQHRAWVQEQNQRIASLSAINGSLEHNVLEARRRYQMLKGANSLLKELQSKLREAPFAQQGGGGRRSEDLDLYSVRSARHLQLELNRGLDLERAAEWQQRSAAYAAARKRRVELQRVKSARKNQRLR